MKLFMAIWLDNIIDRSVENTVAIIETYRESKITSTKLSSRRMIFNKDCVIISIC